MNTALTTGTNSTPLSPRKASRPVTARVSYRTGTPGDADALFTFIDAHVAEGHLLPRQRSELTAHASRFVIAERRGRLIGCAELAPLSQRVAEVRSLVVDRQVRGSGVGRSLVDALHQRATRDRFETLCAFTHEAHFFVRLGFSLVPHSWIPDKIALDCATCPLFRRCGQHALTRSVVATEERRDEVAAAFVACGN